MTFIDIKNDNPEALVPNAQARGRIYDRVLDTIGATPLVRVPKFQAKYDLEAEVLAKLEYFNPVASVKDRIAFAMIEAAERSGEITPGETLLVEPTSGNTGIGLAFVAAQKGYRLILTMPEDMSYERRKMLQILGAELVITPKEEGMVGAIAKAKEILAESDESYCPGQFDNPTNTQIHRETTAEEIWCDTQGNVDMLIAGVGTGGTITGISQVLKERNPHFKTYAVEPKESPVISGGEHRNHKIEGIGAGFVPSILDVNLIDETILIDSQKAIDMAKEMAILEGISCGISSGAVFVAAKKIAQRPENKGKKIVVIVPSFAERYISSPLFEGITG